MSHSPPRLCILGSINMDLVVHAPRFPAPGQTLLGGPFAAHPGGKGANQAVAAARLGAAVSLIGCVGDDAYSAALQTTLRENGVDISAVRVRPGVPTGIGLITIADGGENTIVVAPGANATVSGADVEAAHAAIANADILLMQLELPMDATLRAAAIARDSGVTVILNAAPAAILPDGLLLNTDALIVNEIEGATLAALPPTVPRDSVLARLAALGPSTVVMTLGARGALYARSPSPARLTDPFPVEPVDTVGAGDAFCGALAVRWAEHQIGGAEFDDLAMLDIMSWAAAAGALAATRPGAIPSLPTRSAVAALLKGKER